MSRVKTTEEFQLEIHNKLGEEYTVISSYISSYERIKIRHEKCGNEWTSTPSTILKGVGCAKCHDKSKGKTEKFREKINADTNGEYSLIGEFHTTKTKTMFKHNTCGTEWEMRPEKFKQGQRCPVCSKKEKIRKIKKSEEYVYNYIKNNHNGEYEIIGEYLGADKNIMLRHNKCNHEFEMKFNCFDKILHPCPNCRPKRVSPHKKTLEEFKEEVAIKGNNDYVVLSDEYIDNQTKVIIKHLKCGHIYKVKPKNFTNGTRCPLCSSGNISRSEIEILEFVENNCNHEVIGSYRMNNDTELDIYIPELKLAFEYDGLYWHSELAGKDSKYHLDKTEFAESLGIKLIHIFENEWIDLENREITKSTILNMINKNKMQKINIEDCIIEEISNIESDNFLKNNSIYNKKSKDINICLKYNNKIQYIVSFTNNSNKEFVLDMFVNKINTNIPNALITIIDYFKENYEFDKITTSIDRRYSNGYEVRVYDFKLKEVREPRYFYSKGKTFIYNIEEFISNIENNINYNPDESIHENMLRNRYGRIWDSGYYVFESNSLGS